MDTRLQLGVRVRRRAFRARCSPIAGFAASAIGLLFGRRPPLRLVLDPVVEAHG